MKNYPHLIFEKETPIVVSSTGFSSDVIPEAIALADFRGQKVTLRMEMKEMEILPGANFDVEWEKWVVIRQQ